MNAERIEDVFDPMAGGQNTIKPAMDAVAPCLNQGADTCPDTVATMDLSPELISRLSVLTGAFPVSDDGRTPLNADDPIAAILDEVDATVLGASLRFITADKVLEVQITGRRIILVSKINDPAASQLIDRVLSASSEDDANALTQALVRFANGIDTAGLSLEAGPLRSDLIGISGRLSKAMIEKTLADMRPANSTLSAPDGIVGTVHDLGQAFLQFGDGQPEFGFGDQQLVEGLQTFRHEQLENILRAESRTKPLCATPELTILTETLGPGICLGLLRSDTQTLIFAFDVTDLFDVISRFDNAA